MKMWKTCEDAYIGRNPLTENEDERKTENLKHRPWERRKSLGKATFREQRRTKIRTEAYLRVLQFGRTEEPPLYQILDSQSTRRQKSQRNVRCSNCTSQGQGSLAVDGFSLDVECVNTEKDG